jgi:hypothetical protein
MPTVSRINTVRRKNEDLLGSVIGAFRRKSVWVAIVVYVACLTFGLSYGREFGSSLIGVIIGGGVGGFIYIQVVTRAMLPDLRAAVGKKK